MADGVEEAIIALVVQGQAQASQAAGKVEADLSSVERAGKTAESTARQASVSVQELGERINYVTAKLDHAVRLATKLAKQAGAGEETSAIGDAATEGLTTAHSAYRVLSVLGPEVAIPGAIIAGAFSGISTYMDHEAQLEKHKAEEQAKVIAEELHRRESEALSNNTLGMELVRQAGLAKLGSLTGGGRSIP